VRIYYTVNRAENWRLTLPEIRRSNLVATCLRCDTEPDINKVPYRPQLLPYSGRSLSRSPPPAPGAAATWLWGHLSESGACAAAGARGGGGDGAPQILSYFSYEHFYVLYCKFWELDTDHDQAISKAVRQIRVVCMADHPPTSLPRVACITLRVCVNKHVCLVCDAFSARALPQDFARYATGALSERTVARIFAQVPRKFTSPQPGTMCYEDFICLHEREAGEAFAYGCGHRGAVLHVRRGCHGASQSVSNPSICLDRSATATRPSGACIPWRAPSCRA